MSSQGDEGFLGVREPVGIEIKPARIDREKRRESFAVGQKPGFDLSDRYPEAHPGCRLGERIFFREGAQSS
jgi:hypothetical protein